MILQDHPSPEAKRQILNAVTPKAVLHALTPEAAYAVPYAQLTQALVSILQFPYRVGRESRTKLINDRIGRIERPKSDHADPNNDLYLVDSGTRMNISREHFSIVEDAGRYRLIDRGSACGTQVGDTRIGGEDSGGSHPLQDGDVIGIGTANTPYWYRFIDLSDARLTKSE